MSSFKLDPYSALYACHK